MKSKLLFVLGAGAMLMGCAQTIPTEQAKEVANAIATNLESEEFEKPTKLTAEIKQTIFKNDGKHKTSVKFVTDEDTGYLYLSEKTDKGTEETWSYQEGPKIIIAQSYDDGSKKTQIYTETIYPYTSSSYSIDAFVKMTYQTAKEMKSVEEALAEGQVKEYSFKSNGAGSLILEVSGYQGERGKTVIENNLLSSYEYTTDDQNLSYVFKWGVANNSKPDLSTFTQMDF